MMDVSSGSELSDEASAPFSKTKRPKQSRKFTPVQIIELNTLYRSGMKGVGRQYASAIEHASTRTGLTSE